MPGGAHNKIDLELRPQPKKKESKTLGLDP